MKTTEAPDGVGADVGVDEGKGVVEGGCAGVKAGAIVGLRVEDGVIVGLRVEDDVEVGEADAVGERNCVGEGVGLFPC